MAPSVDMALDTEGKDYSCFVPFISQQAAVSHCPARSCECGMSSRKVLDLCLDKHYRLCQVPGSVALQTAICLLLQTHDDHDMTKSKLLFTRPCQTKEARPSNETHPKFIQAS